MTNAWKTAQAEALDAQALAIADALAELSNVEAVLEQRGRDKLAAELRGVAAGLRSEQAAMSSEARALRAAPAANGGFPTAVTLATTTRHPREHR